MEEFRKSWWGKCLGSSLGPEEGGVRPEPGPEGEGGDDGGLHALHAPRQVRGCGGRFPSGCHRHLLRRRLGCFLGSLQ